MRTLAASLLASATLLGAVSHASAQDKSLTLCWAAWDPANALAELSKDFTAESGIAMNFEFVPWTNFADRFLNELNSGGKLCDLMIGDSQWLGAGAEYGHYVKLNDFFAAQGISMDDFLPGHGLQLLDLAQGRARVLGAAGDGRRARLDLPQGLVRPARDPGGLQGRVRPRPRRAQELGRADGDRQVLPGPRDRRQDRLRRRDLHRARLRGHHHGRDRGALSLGLQVPGPGQPLSHGRLRQLARSGRRARVLQGRCSSAARRPGTPTPT